MKWFEKIFKNVLYYPGCLMKFVAKDINENYKRILRKCGIDFIQLSEIEVCCGSPLINAGLTETAKSLANKNFKIFKQHRVKEIITPCPACFKTFSQDYPKFVENWDIEVRHVTQVIKDAISEGKLKIREIERTVTFHDPCYLGRYCNVYEEPREILRKIGCEIKEMEMNKEHSLCCGAGGGLQSNFPEIANSIAKERIEQALKTKAKILVTACPLCYLHLKRNSKKIEVKELSELVIESIY